MTLVGRFGRSSFAVAPGVAAASSIDSRDATQNAAFQPVHLLHLGVWFKNAATAAAAGCSSAITPFNAAHYAGVQVLTTRQFPPDAGPLGRLH